MKRTKLTPMQVLVGIVILTLVLAGWKSLTPAPKSYSFVTVDHPVDMWQDGKDKWAYYSMGPGETKDLAAKVRAELGPEGFVEDPSAKPWYEFDKGNVSVVVCNHHEFGVNRTWGGSKLMKPKPSTTGPSPGPWPCILVKNGPGTDTSINWFKVKKVLHGW
ncbi:MAG: hypothetical protein JST12_03240 [Armatimonadetes bacterium]|nr:hypothetical protein [Armatimonadota bacterium]